MHIRGVAMGRAELIERINAHHAEFLGRAQPANFRETDQLSDTGLDSLARITFILYLQERFDVRIPLEAVGSQRISTLGDLAELIDACRGMPGG